MFLKMKIGMMAHTYNPITWKAEAEQSNFKAKLDSSLKKSKKKKKLFRFNCLSPLKLVLKHTVGSCGARSY